MKRFHGLTTFKEVISFIEEESREKIISEKKKCEVYDSVIEARNFILASDKCGRRSEYSKYLKSKAVHRIHPVYMEFNIDYEVLGALLGRSIGWFTLNFKNMGLTRKSNKPRVPNYYTKYYCDVKVFNHWTAESAYWLGYIWADGHVRISQYRRHLRIVLQESDSNHLELFRKFLKTNAPIKRELYKAEKNGKKHPQAVLTINRKELAESLVLLNVLVDRSVNDIEFPDVPEKYIWDFFRGFFDGDGAVHRPQSCKFLCSGWSVSFAGSKTNLESVREKIFRDTGVEMNLRQNGESLVNFSLSRTGPAIFEILNRLYPDHVQLGLERKRSKIHSLLKAYRFAQESGVSIAKRGDGLRFIVPKGFRFSDDWENLN